MAESRLVAWDIVVVVVYFITVVSIGIFASCRAKRGSLSGYFLAGRQMTFLTVGASLFVSNIGSEHFIGLAGSGAAGGIGVGAWEFNAILLLQLLGWVFIPVYIACQTFTMPEYLAKRFGGQRVRVYFAFLSLALYVFTKTSVDLYTGALFIQQSLGWDLYLCIFVLIGITAVLTITGGLTAVIYTDTLQAVLMVGGAIILMIYGFVDIGGYDGLVRKYMTAVPNVTVANQSCHLPSENSFTMLREPNDPDMPWPGFLLGQTPGSIWYWCSDQVIVQRALAAKSLSHAQGATLMAGFIKILPLFIMVMPGMISRIKYPNEVACVDPDVCEKVCQSRAGCTNIAYPRLVLGLMPDGLRGLMMAVMIAAIMSDLDSIFNSASTLFTIDIWKRIRKSAGVRELLIVGRVFVLVMVGVAVAWVPVIKETQGGQVFIYIQEITDYLAPPIAAVFLMGLLWTRFNEQGCFWGLMVGFVTGIIRLILVFVYRAPEECGEEDTRPAIIQDVHYMYFAILLFWITVVSGTVVTYMTPPPKPEQLLRTTFWTRFDKRSHEAAQLGYGFDAVDVATQTTGNGTDNPTFEGDSEANGQELSSKDDEQGKDGVFTITEANTTPPKEEEKLSLTDRLVEWVCGFRPDHGTGTMEDHDERKHEQHLYIKSLEQDPRAKLGLTVGLFGILGIGVFLYVFWSTWKYVPA